MTKLISLTRGYTALVDDSDYEKLKTYKWSAGGPKGYLSAQRAQNGKTIRMHRQILGLLDAPSNVFVDHRNGDTLDNRRSNLRACDNRLNQGNARKRGGSSRYRGVSWHEVSKGWRAQIRIKGMKVHLGIFKDEEDAARAYDKAASQHFGDFARLNQPE